MPPDDTTLLAAVQSVRNPLGTRMLRIGGAAGHNVNFWVSLIGIYDPSTRPGGRMTFDEVLQFVESRLDVSRSFRERLITVPFGLDRPLWINDGHFDLEFHVREIALPDPGDWRQSQPPVRRRFRTSSARSRGTSRAASSTVRW